ncbi:phage tail protein, partial [Bifidobacterium xylocopae]
WKGTSIEQTRPTPEREFPTWRPNPDKSWILKDPASGRWQAVIDPSKSNTTGADEHTFLDGDKVGGVVNGTVDPHLIEAPTKFELADDWSAADYLVDQEGGTAAMRVYEADAVAGPDGHYRQSSVADIANRGRDVTAQFDITLQGNKAVATAKPAYLAKLRGMGAPLQVTLLVPFTVNFANGGGAGQVRRDSGRRPGDEMTFCEAPGAGPASGRALKNKGSETVNNQETPTNEPKICGYVPPVRKDVVSEASQGG